jgi:hypothetical protein
LTSSRKCDSSAPFPPSLRWQYSPYLRARRRRCERRQTASRAG